MRISKEFYEISRSLDRYHKDHNKNHFKITKCIHCSAENPISGNSILCRRCNDIFYEVHKLDVIHSDYKGDNFLWIIATKSSSYEEFRLKAMLMRFE